MVRDLPFKEKELGGGLFLRVFDDAEEEELVWHRDREDREVETTTETDWMLQLEDELPVRLEPGKKLFIPAKKYHRLVKGGDTSVSVIVRKITS